MEMFQPKPPGQYETGAAPRNTPVEAKGYDPMTEQMPAEPMIPQRKPSSTIKEYLDWARATAKTPTFTNIQGNTGQFDTGPEGGAHMVKESDPNMQPRMDPNTGQPYRPAPVMPQRGEVDRDSDPSKYTDPWDYADKNSQHVLPVLWERMFPGRPYRSELTVGEKKQWSAKADDQMKVLIDKGKYIMRDRNTNKKDRITMSQIGSAYDQANKDYEAMLAKPEGITKEAWVRQEVESKIKSMNEIYSGVNPGSEVPGQRQAAGGIPTSGPTRRKEGMPTAEEFKHAAKSFYIQYNGDQKQIMAAMKQKYPNLIK